MRIFSLPSKARSVPAGTSDGCEYWPRMMVFGIVFCIGATCCLEASACQKFLMVKCACVPKQKILCVLDFLSFVRDEFLE